MPIFEMEARSEQYARGKTLRDILYQDQCHSPPCLLSTPWNRVFQKHHLPEWSTQHVNDKPEMEGSDKV